MDTESNVCSNNGVSEVVESWWNGRMGRIASQRVRLCHRDGAWSVEHLGPWGGYTVTPCADEVEARREAERTRMESAAPWRRVDHLTH